MFGLLLRIVLCSWLCVAFLALHAQSIIFNEVMPSNSIFFDEDGDSPDWIELYNQERGSILLNGWTVTDNKEIPNKWRFPDMEIAASAYLMIWASGKDRLAVGTPRTLISQGDSWRYIIPTAAVDPQWKEVDYNDASWQEGASGFGYGDGDDATIVPAGTRAIFMRKRFSVSNLNDIQELILDIDYDDAFVAYINGREVARANINDANPAYNAATNGDHEAQLYQNGRPSRYTLSNLGSFLQQGENVFCVQVHNISNTSSDLSMIPFLSALFNSPSNEGIFPPEVLELRNRALHTNFKISAEGETLYLFDASVNLVDSLQIENIPANISYGARPASNEFLFYDKPTPGQANTTDGYPGILDPKIIFSHEGGTTSISSLSLSGTSSGETIRYTLDASPPHSQSPVYTGPISITQNTVVRARIYKEGLLPSQTQSRTYILNAQHDLPVISLVTQPANLFDFESGIYVMGGNAEEVFPHFGANFWQDWERPMHISLYETNGDLGIAFNGGAKIFGGWSRGMDQKSFSIFARKQYGLGEIEYPLFPNQDYDEYQAFILRNSGNDWVNTMIRDAALTGLMKGSGVDYQAYRPFASYINGQYWGIYNMREKVNEHFLASKHDLDPDDIDLLELDGRIIHGDNRDYIAIINYVNANSLVDDASYQQVANQIDIENFQRYQLAQIYFDNTDWPGNNIKYWRPKDGKWRWILFDTDFGFGIWDSNNYQKNTLAFALEADGPGWPNPPWSTLLFRKLMENQSFRYGFINQFADALNSRFLPEKVSQHIDTLALAIASEVNMHYSRWNRSPQGWENQVRNMKVFGQRRPLRIKQLIRARFGLVAFHKLTIENPTNSQGQVQVNSLHIKDQLWTGDYFEGVPIKVKAIPAPGFSFSHWTGDFNSTQAELDIDIPYPISLQPHFVESTPEEALVIINEINYRSSEDFDTGDWVELHNLSPGILNLSTWELKDNRDDRSFVFPEGSLIDGNGYLVLARNLNDFKALHPDIENVIGDIDFGFSSDGDAVRLFDNNGILRDEVVFLPSPPWPTEANGQGPTLELKQPTLDNAQAENWASLHPFGSPGRSNIDGNPNPVPGNANIQAFSYYPNPFTESINITFRLQEAAHIHATLYDIHGAKVHVFVNEVLSPGEHYLIGKLSFLSHGMYFLRLQDGQGHSSVHKWIKSSE